MTRTSTPKYEVFHTCGTVVLSGVSKTDAVKFARDMDRGSKVKRFQVRPVRRAA